MKIFKYFLFGLLAALLVACGGGGGNASSTGDNTSGGGTTGASTLSLAVVDSSDALVSSISFGGGQRIRATYKTSSGAAVTGKLVTFSATINSSAVVLSPLYKTTNSSGVAYIDVSPSTASTFGAARVSATADSITSTVDFDISGSTVTLGDIVFGSVQLAASGNTSVQIKATANGNAASGIPIAFTADCGSVTPNIPTTDGTGTATATFSALKADGNSCSGTTYVTATATGASKKSSVTVSAPTATAINFVSADPLQMYVTGSGATSQSILKFKVLTASGAPFSGANVTISLVENPGGVGLGTAGSTASIPLTSDSTGIVAFTAFAGAKPGPVKILAALTSDAKVYAYSNNLTVQSGPPSQDRFSLAATTFNIEGRDWDGTTSGLTVRLADRQGNPVAAGTVVNFTTGAGAQVGSSCTVELDVNGIAGCKTTVSSQDPRSANGRVSVLAFAEGLKTFIDNDGSNTYTNIDTLTNMGDAYRDDNENGRWDAGEFILSRGGTGVCSGTGQPTPARADTCTNLVSTTVRSQFVFIMSGSYAYFNEVYVYPEGIYFRLNDSPTGYNPLPYNTSIAAKNTGASSCAVTTIVPAKVDNIGARKDVKAQLGSYHALSLSGCAPGDSLLVTVTTPKQVATYNTFIIPSADFSTTAPPSISLSAGASSAEYGISGGVAKYTATSSDESIATASITSKVDIDTKLTSYYFIVRAIKSGSATIVIRDFNGMALSYEVTVP